MFNKDYFGCYSSLHATTKSKKYFLRQFCVFVLIAWVLFSLFNSLSVELQVVQVVVLSAFRPILEQKRTRGWDSQSRRHFVGIAMQCGELTSETPCHGGDRGLLVSAVALSMLR